MQLWLQPNSCNLWTKIRIKKKTVDTSAKVISQSVAASINENLQEIITKLDDVKKETSTDPRKELANRGIDFSPTSFAESLYRGDDSNIMLFLKAGMEYDEARDPYGENFEEMFYRTDIDKLSKSLKTLSDLSKIPSIYPTHYCAPLRTVMPLKPSCLSNMVQRLTKSILACLIVMSGEELLLIKQRLCVLLIRELPILPNTQIKILRSTTLRLFKHTYLSNTLSLMEI